MVKTLLKKGWLAFFLLLNYSVLNAQTWDSIPVPVTSNLILQDIVFPDGQSMIGYTGGTNVTYNGKGKILKTTDGGDTWVVQWESDDSGTGVTSLHFFTTTTGLAGTMSGDIMKTTDGGTTWTSWDIDSATDQGELSDMDFYDDDNGAIVSLWGGIYISDDAGETWTVASTNYTSAIDLYYADQNTLFAAGYDQNIYKSTDGGDTWIFNYQGSNGSNGNSYINLGVFFKDANNGIVTSEEGDYFLTSDGGDTWTSASISTQNGLMRSAYMFDTDNIYICATPGEVFYTSDNGTQWNSQYYDFDPSLYKITFTSDGTGFVCGSSGTGVGGTILKMDPTGLGLEEVSLNNFSVYPNPCSDYLTIDYDSQLNDNYMLTLFDNTGKRVMNSTISLKSGINSERLNISHLSEGIYILNIVGKNENIGSYKVQIIK